MRDETLPVVLFDGVPAHRVWRDAEGHVWAELPRTSEPVTVISAWVTGCQMPPLGVRIENA